MRFHLPFQLMLKEPPISKTSSALTKPRGICARGINKKQKPIIEYKTKEKK